MTRIKQAGASVLIVALLAGAIGYILGCTQQQRDQESPSRHVSATRIRQVLSSWVSYAVAESTELLPHAIRLIHTAEQRGDWQGPLRRDQ